MQNKSRNKKGFTLPELLIVVIVAAILSSVVVPMYAKAVKRSRASDALKVLSVAAASQEAHLIDTQNYASTFSELSAPIKGLSGTNEVTVGKYKYTLDRGCMIATPTTKDKYQIYKNFQTQENGCIGKDCDILMNIIPAMESLNCELISFGSSDGNVVTDDFCEKNPHLCGTPEDKKCPAGKVLNIATGECVCATICSYGGKQDPNTCKCTCPSSCPASGQVMNTTNCSCSCPSDKPYLYDGKCNVCKQGSINTSTGECCPPNHCYDSSIGICRPEYDGPKTQDQTCGGGNGTQSRTWQEGCPGNWGPWGACKCADGYILINGLCKICMPNSTQACGTQCGTQTCSSDGMSWGYCSGEGICSPGQSSSLGCDYGGSKICTSSCAWGGCEGGGVCTPGEEEPCGKCGTRECGSNYMWGSCTNEGVCSPNEAEACGNGGSRTCTSECKWGDCAGEGDCTPGQKRDCANCGKQTCGNDYKWGDCLSQGVCNSGEMQYQLCPAGTQGSRSRSCSPSCAWGAWIGICKECDCTPGQVETQPCVSGDCGAAVCTGNKERTCLGSGTCGNWGPWDTFGCQAAPCQITSCPSGRYLVHGGTSQCCCENNMCNVPGPNGHLYECYCTLGDVYGP